MQIKRYFHVFEPQEDKLPVDEWFRKVEPLNSNLRRQFKDFYEPPAVMTADEMMVRYFGRSADTTKMPGKPIKQGYKVFALCSHTGYTWDWRFSSPRAGITELPPRSPAVDLPPTKAVVYHMAKSLPYQKHKFQIYMDNLFTTIPLLLKLRELGIGGCGTTRTFPKEFQKDGDRLPWNTVTGGYTADGKVLALQWEDQKSVRMLSTIHQLLECIERERKRPRPTSTRGRTIRQIFGDEQRMVVPIPCAINDYNRGKVGVDLSDQYRAAYFTQPITRRNWPPLLFFLFDITIINAFLLFTRHHRKFYESGRVKRMLSHKEFRLTLAQELAEQADKEVGDEAGFGHRPLRRPNATRYESECHKRTQTHLCYRKTRGITTVPTSTNPHTGGRHERSKAMKQKECVRCRFRMRQAGEHGRAKRTTWCCSHCKLYFCVGCF
jgi:hypothetical protein